MDIQVCTTSGLFGHLTTEHSASSYGIPILIFDRPSDGELEEGALRLPDSMYDRPFTAIEAAEHGWLLHDAICPAPEAAQAFNAAGQHIRNAMRAQSEKMIAEHEKALEEFYSETGW